MRTVGSWAIHFMNARGLLNPYMERVEEALCEVSNRANLLGLNVVLDVEIEAARYGGITEVGHSGYVPRPGLMRLMLDPYNDNLAQHMGEPLERMIAHELHHALRWDTVGYGTTLLGALVSEGLCGRFTEELYENAPELQECAISSEEIQRFSREAVVQADEENYDHNRWFFGEKDLPRWTGYTIGYELVGKSMQTMNLKPSEMVATEAELFMSSLESLASD